VEIDTHEVKSWLETNWIWVVAGVVLLLLIVLLSRGSRTTNNRTIAGGERRTTTVVKDAQGNVQSVTTTEEKL
jgi:predicted negative regulator of RcsB-dependent stress response